MPSLSPLNRRVYNPVLLFPIKAGSSYYQVNTTTLNSKLVMFILPLNWQVPRSNSPLQSLVG